MHCHALWCSQASAVLLLLLLSMQRRWQQEQGRWSLPLQEVAAHVDEGVRVGRDAMEGEVWCGAVLASAASPVTTVWWQGLTFFLQGGIVTSALLRQRCALRFLVNCGVTASNGSERAVWSGSRAVAGTKPRMAVDEAEGMVAGGAKMLVGEAEATGVAVHETRTGAAMGDIEVVGNAEAETGSVEALADVGREETSEGMVADKTGVVMGDDAQPDYIPYSILHGLQENENIQLSRREGL
ncbi:hypothetical protein F5148DRAFT_1150794 [Russula earlei]|uniref:Uncharacterized protein n=1 Tax=Russula earlei TaxID=71964 RepID=A0ACC0U3Z6_9AGAM|nr:hypothetical protein F5148DRAFT_1150794 [Russula earlei]